MTFKWNQKRAGEPFNAKSNEFVTLVFSLIFKVFNVCVLLTEVLRRWVDPEFKDEEDMTIEVEAGTGTEEEVSVVDIEDTGEVGNNGAIREEVVVVNLEISKL